MLGLDEATEHVGPQIRMLCQNHPYFESPRSKLAHPDQNKWTNILLDSISYELPGDHRIDKVQRFLL